MCDNPKANLKIYNTLMFWSTQIVTEISSKKNVFCRCKYKILEAKWFYWLLWYHKNTYYVFNNNTLNLSDELLKISDGSIECTSNILNINVEKTINDTNEIWQKYIKKDKTIFPPVLEIFNEVHQVLIEEFTDLLAATDNIDYLEYVNLVGKILYDMCKNSIFEMAEMNIPCKWLETGECKIPVKCSENYDQMDEKKSLKLFVNNVYNVNNFAIRKIEKLYNRVYPWNKTKKTPLKITFNFKYYTEWNIEKIKKMIEYTCKHFDHVSLSGIRNEKFHHILAEIIISEDCIEKS